jgi:hypothetical protein
VAAAWRLFTIACAEIEGRRWQLGHQSKTEPLPHDEQQQWMRHAFEPLLKSVKPARSFQRTLETRE